MLRRAALLCALALLVPVAAGCGSSTPSSAQASRQMAFLKRHKDLNDPQLAVVCPSLYPSDFLKRPGHYRFDKKDRGYKPTAAELADAKAAGCTSQGTKPKK